MKNIKDFQPILLISVLIPIVCVILATHKIIFRYDNLEKWRLILYSVGGTILLMGLLTALLIGLLFKKERLD